MASNGRWTSKKMQSQAAHEAKQCAEASNRQRPATGRGKQIAKASKKKPATCQLRSRAAQPGHHVQYNDSLEVDSNDIIKVLLCHIQEGHRLDNACTAMWARVMGGVIS
jgi:hypothetical protein